MVHFFLLGALIFALFAYFDDAPAPKSANAIVITEADARRLVSGFEAVWKRIPTAEELDHLIDGHLREEVYVREAVALGLDRNDAVIRRRLQMKMEFLTETGAEAIKPNDATLNAHMQAKPDQFIEPLLLAFEQVLLPDDMNSEEISAAVSSLNEGRSPSDFTRSSLLPPAFSPSPEKTVDGNFGTGFFNALLEMPVGKWAGPVQSPLGRHLVHIIERRQARMPPLSDIRKRVEADWRADLAARLREESYQALLSRYSVVRPDTSAVLSP